ncbi:MAG: DUF1345 domain-containing protein [Ferruginibacter sp.]
MSIPQHNKTGNIFLRMHPLQRILLSIAISLTIFLLTRNNHLSWILNLTILWDVFALSFIVTSWVVFFTRPLSDIKKQANKEDGSRLFVLLSILVSSFASMVMVLLLMIKKDQPPGQGLLIILLSISGMVFSWIMVHTIFTFHYAHMYYYEGKDDTPGKDALVFPNEKTPDYLDFAYFAFVIGMTFQVSDVEINSRRIRRLAMAHGLLAFALNTFVVALTINLIAGLKK